MLNSVFVTPTTRKLNDEEKVKSKQKQISGHN